MPSAPTPLPVAGTPEFLALQQAVKGRYSIERELGRGGMGVVFLARDVALDRHVAIKLLPPDLAERADLRALFLREARTAAKLSHPHIVPIHAVEEHGHLVFFVMTFVDGDTLGARVRRAGPLAPGEVTRIIQEVAWALGHAHAHGVVHRDVKPDNILLERGTGRALVTDFGIAHVVQSRDPARTTGGPVGTPQYMSPEQAHGDDVDGRSDLYSLGVTAYFAATGHLPFHASGAHALMLQHAEEPAPPVERDAPRLPPAFAATVNRLLAKAPTDRFDSADALAAAIGDARSTLGVVPSPVRRYVQVAEQIGGEIAMLTTTAAGSVIAFEVMKMLEGDFMGIATALEWVLAATLLGIAGTRAVQLVGDTRKLIRDGYRHDALRAAIVIADREHDLERAGDAPPHALPRTWITALGGLALSALGFYFADKVNRYGLDMVGWIVGVTTPAITVRRVWRDLRAGKAGTFWNRLMEGRLGRGLFAIAGRTVRDAPMIPSAEPTAVVLARATEDLYHALPAEHRRRLGDMPKVIAGLEADAAVLRQLDGADPARLRRDLLALSAPGADAPALCDIQETA